MVRSYFERLGFRVEWLGHGQPIRVFSPDTGCSAMIMPENYRIKDGQAWADDWVAGAVKNTIARCAYRIRGYPKPPEVPRPPVEVPTVMRPTPEWPIPHIPIPWDVDEMIKRRPRPKFISASEWRIVTEYCIVYDVEPLIIAAIGWHETKWNTHPDAPRDYHLGVGVLGRRRLVTACKGLVNQFRCYITTPDGVRRRWIEFASEMLGMDITRARVLAFGQRVQQPAKPEAWARSVYRIYRDLAKEITKEPPGRPLSPLPGIFPEAREAGIEEFNTLAQQAKCGGESMARVVYYDQFTQYLNERMGRK